MELRNVVAGGTTIAAGDPLMEVPEIVVPEQGEGLAHQVAAPDAALAALASDLGARGGGEAAVGTLGPCRLRIGPGEDRRGAVHAGGGARGAAFPARGKRRLLLRPGRRPAPHPGARRRCGDRRLAARFSYHDLAAGAVA